MTAVHRRGVGAPRVLGRAGERRVVEGFIRAAPVKRAILLLEGPAGVGKTTLWRVGVAAARAGGATVLKARPAEHEVPLALAGFGDLFGGVAPEAAAALPAPQRHALDVALLRADAVAAEGPLVLAAATLGLLRALAAEAPVVVAVDDVQWLDEPTAAVLAYAIRRLGGEDVRFLVAARPGSEVVERLLPRDDGVLERLVVRPLDDDSIADIVADVLPSGPERAVMRRILAVAAGNPLHAKEVALALRDRPTAHGDALPVPEDVQALLDARVAALPAATRRALLVTATVGVHGGSAIDLDALGPAVDAGLVAIGEHGPRFVHPLHGAAVYRGSPVRDRREAHRVIAEAAPDPVARALHLALAADGPDAEVAAMLEAAAPLVAARGAADGAASMRDHAWRLTPREPVSAWVDRGLAAAAARISEGDRERGLAILGVLQATGIEGDDRAEALRLRAECDYSQRSFEEAGSRFAEALAAATSPRKRAAILLGTCFVDAAELRFVDGGEHARLAEQEARVAGQPGVAAVGTAHRVMFDYLVGKGADLPAMAAAITAQEPLPEYSLERTPRSVGACLDLYLGNLDPARDAFEAILREARDRGAESDVAFHALWLSWLELNAGRWARAREVAEDGERVARLTGSATMEGWLVAQRALIAAHEGDLEAVGVLAERAAPVVMSSGNRLAPLWLAAATSLAALSAGDAGRAWEVTTPFVDVAAATGLAEPVPFFFLPTSIEALVEVGDLLRAAGLAALLLERGRTLDRPWAIATGARCAALVNAAEGRADDAERLLTEALAAHARIPMPFEEARTLLVLGRIRRRRRARRAAREALGAAAGTFEALGATAWLAGARAELERTGSTRVAADQLTRTEQAVAELAALGETNRAIAARLFISERTVEANLGRAYRKLGLRSRAQLAARLAAGSRDPMLPPDGDHAFDG